MHVSETIHDLTLLMDADDRLGIIVHLGRGPYAFADVTADLVARLAYALGGSLSLSCEVLAEVVMSASQFSDMITNMKNAKPIMAALSKVLAKKSIGKKDREVIAGLFERVLREQADSAPFTLRMFGESVDKLTTEAKREVEASMTAMIHAAGLESIQGGSVDMIGALGMSERAALQDGES